MPKRYLIANWKMNTPPEGIETFLGAMSGTDVVIAPPFVYIKDVVAASPDGVRIAGQNCSDQKAGAYTGEVSAQMLLGCGASFVILGHSERRNLYGENDAFIARKLSLAIETGLTPVLCIGETLEERDSGRAAELVARQIEAAAVPQLADAGEIVVAYEPVWAIGTGRNATPEICADMSATIRDSIARFWPDRDVSLLYGGSVTPENVADLVDHGRIDGFLVGGASLDSRKFRLLYEALGTRDERRGTRDDL